jgi:DNA transformation protein
VSKATTAAEVRRLTDIPNIGKAMAADLQGLGITTPAQVQAMDPLETYDRLRDPMGQRHDPCVLDTFMAAHDFMNGGPAQAWWKFTVQRKQLLASTALAGQTTSPADVCGVLNVQAGDRGKRPK